MKTLRTLTIWMLVLAGLVVVLRRYADAESMPPPRSIYVKGTSLAAGGNLIKSGAAVLTGYQGYIHYGGTGWLMLFSATSEPTLGAAPIWSTPACGQNTECLATIPMGGIRVANPYLACSSTNNSYSACGALGNDASFSAEYR